MTEKTCATSICQRLQNLGHLAVLAGGCVRDMLLGLDPKDFDIATSATPDEVETLFEHTVAVGKQFGVIVVRESGFEFEVATFRTDSIASDGRRPESVAFSSMEEDAARRDLTINALFFDPVSEELFDFVNGKLDLDAGVIRLVGAPVQRIAEDHLRIMRVVRFASRFGFVIADSTAKAVRGSVKLLHDVSAERIKDELDKMLVSADPGGAIKMLHRLGILAEVLPEVAALDGAEQSARWHAEGDVFVHTLMVLAQTRRLTDDLPTLWGALLHDIGKPATAALNKHGNICNHGHEFVGERMAEEILRRLKAPVKDIRKVKFLVREHMRVKNVSKMKRFKVRRLAASEWIWDLVKLGEADAKSSIPADPRMNEGKMAWKDVLMALEDEVGLGLPRAVLSGDDLVAMGFKPGPAFAEVLDKVQEMQLEDKILTTEDAKAFVLKRFRSILAPRG